MSAGSHVAIQHWMRSRRVVKYPKCRTAGKLFFAVQQFLLKPASADEPPTPIPLPETQKPISAWSQNFSVSTAKPLAS
jgi:hypothetical protein